MCACSIVDTSIVLDSQFIFAKFSKSCFHIHQDLYLYLYTTAVLRSIWGVMSNDVLIIIIQIHQIPLILTYTKKNKHKNKFPFIILLHLRRLKKVLCMLIQSLRYQIALCYHNIKITIPNSKKKAYTYCQNRYAPIGCEYFRIQFTIVETTNRLDNI